MPNKIDIYHEENMIVTKEYEVKYFISHGFHNKHKLKISP